MKLLPTLTASFAMTVSSLLSAAASVDEILERIRNHNFHPVREGFTYDRDLNKHGVADLQDRDWKIRTLAVRDLVRAEDASAIIAALRDKNDNVRYLAAMALGIHRTAEAVPVLQEAFGGDTSSTVRSQAAVALGQIGDESSLTALRAALEKEKDRDVIHQAKIAIHAITSKQPATPELAKAFASLDEATFSVAEIGKSAPDFSLTDTNGKSWRLSDFRGRQAVALIWIFADWCPVCHGEFRELIELKDEFKKAGIQPVTLECHDLLPARIMVGKEIDPDYWFAKDSFRQTYTEKIWWPHLVDRAATVGLKYNIQPLAYAVHAELINRPTVALIDKEGILRFLYQGTFWGDRPSIHELLDMMKSGDYNFIHSNRLKPASKN